MCAGPIAHDWTQATKCTCAGAPTSRAQVGSAVSDNNWGGLGMGRRRSSARRRGNGGEIGAVLLLIVLGFVIKAVTFMVDLVMAIPSFVWTGLALVCVTAVAAKLYFYLQARKKTVAVEPEQVAPKGDVTAKIAARRDAAGVPFERTYPMPLPSEEAQLAEPQGPRSNSISGGTDLAQATRNPDAGTSSSALLGREVNPARELKSSRRWTPEERELLQRAREKVRRESEARALAKQSVGEATSTQGSPPVRAAADVHAEKDTDGGYGRIARNVSESSASLEPPNRRRLYPAEEQRRLQSALDKVWADRSKAEEAARMQAKSSESGIFTDSSPGVSSDLPAEGSLEPAVASLPVPSEESIQDDLSQAGISPKEERNHLQSSLDTDSAEVAMAACEQVESDGTATASATLASENSEKEDAGVGPELPHRPSRDDRLRLLTVMRALREQRHVHDGAREPGPLSRVDSPSLDECPDLASCSPKPERTVVLPTATGATGTHAETELPLVVSGDKHPEMDDELFQEFVSLDEVTGAMGEPSAGATRLPTEFLIPPPPELSATQSQAAVPVAVGNPVDCNAPSPGSLIRNMTVSDDRRSVTPTVATATDAAPAANMTGEVLFEHTYFEQFAAFAPKPGESCTNAEPSAAAYVDSLPEASMEEGDRIEQLDVLGSDHSSSPERSGVEEVAVVDIPSSATTPPTCEAKDVQFVRKLVLDTAKISSIQAESESVAALLGQVFSGQVEQALGSLPNPPEVDTYQPLEARLVLDISRIESIQAETRKSDALLGSVFTDEEDTDGPQPNLEDLPDLPLLRVDPAHRQLVHHLLTKPTWHRAELQSIAEELDLMLDGALEEVNEAFYEAFDEPFIEGQDLIEVNINAHALLTHVRQ